MIDFVKKKRIMSYKNVKFVWGLSVSLGDLVEVKIEALYSFGHRNTLRREPIETWMYLGGFVENTVVERCCFMTPRGFEVCRLNGRALMDPDFVVQRIVIPFSSLEGSPC